MQGVSTPNRAPSALYIGCRADSDHVGALQFLVTLAAVRSKLMVPSVCGCPPLLRESPVLQKASQSVVLRRLTVCGISMTFSKHDGTNGHLRSKKVS